MERRCHLYTTRTGTELAFTGPPMDLGPLPTFLYFALSKEESLCLDPYDQPIVCLEEKPVRCLSLTLPGHGEGFDNAEAIAYWADQMAQEKPILEDFFALTRATIEELVSEEVIDPSRLALGGLSRGGFVAIHMAARYPQVKAVLAFAPMTDLAVAQSFAPLIDRPDVQALALSQLADQLNHTALRVYIGNRDVLVSTDHCYAFMRQVVERQFACRIRSPHVELIISPSIGHKGHGTPQRVFHDGAKWIEEQLGL